MAKLRGVVLGGQQETLYLREALVALFSRFSVIFECKVTLFSGVLCNFVQLISVRDTNEGRRAGFPNNS